MFLKTIAGAIIGTLFNTAPNPNVADPNAILIGPAEAARINQQINLGMSHEAAIDSVMGTGASQRLAADRTKFNRGW